MTRRDFLFNRFVCLNVVLKFLLFLLFPALGGPILVQHDLSEGSDSVISTSPEDPAERYLILLIDVN